MLGDGGGEEEQEMRRLPTDSANVEVELRQNPLHVDDKDDRKSEKSERDGIKSDKDKKIMEGLAQYMNQGVNNANAKKAN